ncbi:hypothetical protein [Nocardiopsis rhodophaea]|uniref:hypothetical protein n=1 Tax=Nocardiopsis rhodophaea TaxID=280238 RepID=UPI0039F05ADC
MTEVTCGWGGRERNRHVHERQAAVLSELRKLENGFALADVAGESRVEVAAVRGLPTPRQVDLP